MPTRLDDASIQVRVDTEKARSELEKFRAELKKFTIKDRKELQRQDERENRRKGRREGKEVGAREKTRQTLVKRIVGETASAGFVTLVSKILQGAPEALEELRRQFGGKSDEDTAATRALELIKGTRSELNKVKSSFNAVATTAIQAQQIGLAIARTPAGETIDPIFLTKTITTDNGSLFNYNRLQNKLHTRAKQQTVEFVTRTLVSQLKSFAK